MPAVGQIQDRHLADGPVNIIVDIDDNADKLDLATMRYKCYLIAYGSPMQLPDS